MSDFLDLQGAKDLNTDAIHLSAVANSKDPVTGAPIDTHVNRAGGTDYTLDGLYKAIGPVVMPWTSVTGGTLTQPNQAFLHPANGNYYSWAGAFPKVVAPGSDPAAIGSGYTPRTDVVLRDELTSNVPGDLSNLLGRGSEQFNSLAEALSVSHIQPGRKVSVGGYNINSDGGCAEFEVVSTSDPIGILSTSGTFKLKRKAGHTYFADIVKSGGLPRIAAHRGWSGITTGEFPGQGLSSPIYFVPENTRAAVRFASERGAWAIEGDTKITSDGVPIVFHDTDMSRVTGGAFTGAVSAYTYAEIKAMDVGSYVSSAWANERVMNYDEWLSECRKCRVVPFAEWSHPMTDAQADDFIALAVNYFGTKPTSVCVASTNMDTLKLLRSKNAYIGLCVMGTYGAALSTEILDTAYKLGNCAAMLTGAAITNQTSIADIKARGLLLVCAIANTQSRIDSAIYSGADVIVTDFYKG